MPCLAPVLLLGYAMMIGTSFHPAGHPPAAAVEVQSCQTDLGAYAFATANGLYSAGAQYGLQGQFGPVAVTFTPHLGGSYTDHPVHGLPMRTQFSAGAGVYVTYGWVTTGIKYDHFSNGNAIFNWGGENGRRNLGLDLVVIQTGVLF